MQEHPSISNQKNMQEPFILPTHFQMRTERTEAGKSLHLGTQKISSLKAHIHMRTTTKE